MYLCVPFLTLNSAFFTFKNHTRDIIDVADSGELFFRSKSSTRKKNTNFYVSPTPSHIYARGENFHIRLRREAVVERRESERYGMWVVQGRYLCCDSRALFSFTFCTLPKWDNLKWWKRHFYLNIHKDDKTF